MFNLLWILVLAGHWSGSFGLSARNLKSSSAKSEDECSVGDGCKKYCEGWQESKSLFYITSCPSRHKGEGFCKDMQCIHTSESSADTAGCYCCCGDEASASSVYHGPQGNFRVSEPNSRTRYISSGRQNSPNGCWVGSGCKEYCKGWHESKPLFFISSCPVEFGKRQCGDLKCEHTSESSADSDGCFCCCGEDPSPETVFYGPLSEVHRISGDEALPPPETRDCNQPAFVLGMRAGRAACTRVSTPLSTEVGLDRGATTRSALIFRRPFSYRHLSFQAPYAHSLSVSSDSHNVEPPPPLALGRMLLTEACWC